MSDRPVLPPAAVEISAYRAAAEAAVTGERVPRRAVAGTAIVVLLGVAIVVCVFLVDADAVRVVIAGGVVAVLAVVAGLVMVPLRTAARRRRERIAAAASALDTATAALVSHLASIGYTVPPEVAVGWVTSPDPTATVPMVHDSVIAARWWRPAEGDDRVFVEPFLRDGGTDSALPVLPPVRPSRR